MDHILDNPIWYALLTGSNHFASGNEQALYFPTEVSPLAGLKENIPENLEALYNHASSDRTFVIFTPGEITIPASCKEVARIPLLQMVHTTLVPFKGPEHTFVPLQEKDVPEMIALTQLTNPGPFLSRTIDFGNYIGIFQNHQLIAMAGHRLQPSPYIEVSAVCTHPDHTGKGYSSVLMHEQVRRIMAMNGIPFLHVKADNDGAIHVYQKMGFETRRELLVYVIQKQVSNT